MNRSALLIRIVILAGIILLILSNGPAISREIEYQECTGLIVTGLPSENKTTLVGQSWDARPYPQVFGLRMVTDKETGIKVISDARFRKCPRLSSTGVFHTQNYRSCAVCWDDDPGNSETLYGLKTGEILAKAKNAKEAIELAEKVAQEFGIRSGAGGAKVFADADEVYMIEGQAPGEYDILGPYKDIAVAHANAYLSPSLKQSSEDFNAGYWRQQRAQELLDMRARSMEKVGRMGGLINPQYMMKIFRDHIDGFNWVNCYEHDGNNRSIAGWGSKGRTVFAIFADLPKEDRDVLSVIWTTPNYPPLTPFLPFFIGMPQIPPSFAVGEENKTKVFVELINVVRFNLDFADQVQKFWEAFDDQTTRELSIVLREVKQMLKEGKKEQAGEWLYQYVNNRCEQAVKYAQELTVAINAKGLIKVDPSVFREILEPPRDNR